MDANPTKVVASDLSQSVTLIRNVGGDEVEHYVQDQEDIRQNVDL